MTQWDDPIDIPPSFHHIINACSPHLGYVTKTEGVDKKNRLNCRVCVPSVFGEGEKNWTNPIPVLTNNISTTKNGGDTGIHWPPQVGQQVMVFFKDGDMMQPIAMSGPPWSEESEAGKQMLPTELKNAADQDKQHLVYMMKTPSGHTLYMGDETGKELVGLWHSGGYGIIITGPVSGSEPTQSESSATKARTAYRREDKNVAAQTSEGPGVLKNQTSTVSILGANGSGFNVVDDGQGGTLLMTANASNGSAEGPSIYMSTKEGGLILLTAGGAQLQIRGAKGDIKVTKQVVQEAVKEDVENKYIKKLKDYIKEFVRKGTYTKRTGTGQDSSGKSSSSQSSTPLGKDYSI